MLLLVEDGVVPSWRAASEKLPVSTTLTKTIISPIKVANVFVLTAQRFFGLKWDYHTTGLLIEWPMSTAADP